MKERIRTYRRHLLIFAALVAVVATSGSLYFSLGMGLFPCRLCWYQRILMYPQVVILAVAAYEVNTRVYRTTLPMTLLGLGIAAWHTYLQAVPGAECGFFGCSAIQFQLFGVLTIPNLALIAFVLISGVMCALAYAER